MIPLVSVIIPCYNAERFVEKAVRSIMEQSYRNLEIIVIDDCSQDSTGKILGKLSLEDKRIKYIKNEKNIKLPRTLNKAIRLSSGEYIARMDADDISFPDRFQKQLEFLVSNPNVDLVSANSQYIDENENILSVRTYHPSEHSDIISVLPWKCPFVHPLIMAKRTFFEELNGYDTSLPYAEDYELWIRGWLNSKRYHNLSDILLQYRVHSNQMTSSEFNAKNAKVIRSFLYDYFLKTKKIKFLFGVLLQSKLFFYLIHKTYNIRKLLK